MVSLQNYSFGFGFLNSPEMTVDNVGASVHLSLGQLLCQLFPRTAFFFFSYIGHMLEIVTSKGIVPSGDCSYGILIRTYAGCYSSLLIMGFSLNYCGIGANRFLLFYFYKYGAVIDLLRIRREFIFTAAFL